LLALIDGDICCYRAAASCEPTKAKPDREPQEVAIMRADELMRRILHETSSDTYKLYIGGSDNFRYKIYPEYKANRLDKPKPEYLQDVRAFLVSEWNAEIVNGMEADDAMSRCPYSFLILMM
jgi:5'-3' exonuclease